MSGPMLPVTSKRRAFAPALATSTPGSRGSVGAARRSHLDRLRAQVAQLGERALVDEPALAQDPDSVAERLDLAEDVRREEDGLAALLRLGHGLAEGHLHQRVEAARRLVEDQEVGAARERGDQLHLLAVAVRERAHLLAGVELEALDEHARGRRDPFPRAPARGTRASRRRSGRPQERLAGDVGDRRWAATGSRHASTPNSSARPAVGRCSPSSSRIVVVLPAPFGPR